MLQPDGTAYFYGTVHTTCSHSVLYRITSERSSFCGLCWLTDVFQSEVPSQIHERRTLAVNGKPETSHNFIQHVEAAMGLHEPPPDQPLHRFRRAREQYSREPSAVKLPVTNALWKMFGFQPKMAKPLLRSLLGSNEYEIAAQLDMSLYNVQLTMAKGIRTALRYMR